MSDLSSHGGAVSYQTLRDRLIAGDTTIDYRELRMAYTLTPEYRPYGYNESKTALFAAFRQLDPQPLIEAANRVLEYNYVSMDAHAALAHAYELLEDKERCRFHREVLDGLCESILGEGDGLTPETAWKVICTDEEYAVMLATHRQVVGQRLLYLLDHPYDEITVIDNFTAEQSVFYFDIEIQIKHREGRLR